MRFLSVFLLLNLAVISASFGQNFNPLEADQFCMEQAQSRVADTNLNYVGDLLKEAVEQNLFFQCKQGFVSLDSWVCLDKVFWKKERSSKIIHIDTKYEFWYQASVKNRVVPQLNRYARRGNQGRFNKFELAKNFNLLIEENELSLKLSLNGIKLDNRSGQLRDFQDIECFSVNGLIKEPII